ncbi:MFS transporter [Rhizobium sp. RU36D]|uniref:MFS transporter n=1 Tax=Rhizobium sp. RU36D TaxID=1907415 RepID=UPI0009D80DC2|nr:MFS transporter [Rhizobium sp. RU36D]SMC72012.1 Cyanate permease [Rhizobium sp. RU36D]
MSQALPTTPAAGPVQGLMIQLASSLTVMGAVMVAPILPKLGAEFGTSSPQAAELVPLVATGPALSIALFAPIAGVLADRFGRKAMLLIGTLLYAILGCLPAFLHDLNSILLVRLLFGCAEAILMTCCTTLIADYWIGEERSKYVNRQVVTIGIVGSIFFVIGGAAGESSWRTPFYLYLLPLLLLPFLVKLLWEPARRVEIDAETSAFSKGEIWTTVGLSYLMVFMGMVAAFVVPVMAPGILVALGVTSTAMIGLCTGIGLLATLVGSIAWPATRNRIGIAGTNAWMMALIAVGLLLLTQATSFQTVLVAVVIHGLGVGYLVPNLMLPLLMKLPARFRARGVGGFTSCLYLGQFASPLIIIAIAQGFGGMPMGLGAAINAWATVMLVVAAAWVVVRLAGGAKRHAPTH